MTQRLKASGIHHGDAGLKNPSSITVFVPPTIALDIAGAQHLALDQGQEARPIIVGNQVAVLIYERLEKQKIKPLRYLSHATFSNQPKVGLCPVEFWDPRPYYGPRFYGGWHSGDAISKIL